MAVELAVPSIHQNGFQTILFARASGFEHIKVCCAVLDVSVCVCATVCVHACMCVGIFVCVCYVL